MMSTRPHYRFPRLEDGHSSGDDGNLRKRASGIGAPQSGEDVYDPPLPVPVEVWDSGPVMISNSRNREATSTEMPGEGKVFRTLEEGSRVWKHKTRRRYYEDVKKDRLEDGLGTRVELDKRRALSEVIPDNSSSQLINSKRRGNIRTTSRGAIGDYRRNSKTDDDKLQVSAADLDQAFIGRREARDDKYHNITKSHHLQQHNMLSTHLLDGKKMRSFLHEEQPVPTLVTMEDKGVQCNLKKTSKGPFEISQDFKVIKSKCEDGSVSAFSDHHRHHPSLPLLQDGGSPSSSYLRSDLLMKLPADEHEASPSRRDTRIRGSRNDPNNNHNSNHNNNNYSKQYTTRMARSQSPLSDKNDTSPRRSRPLSRPSPVRTTSSTTSYNFQAGTKSAPDVSPPRIVKTSTSSRSHSPARTPAPPLKPSRDWYYSHGRYGSVSPSKSLVRETIEETMSISSGSTDADPQGDDVHAINRYQHESAVKSIVREIDQENKEFSYQNQSTLKRRSDMSPFDTAVGGGGLWFRSLDDDYRRSMAQNDVTVNVVGIKDPTLDQDATCNAFSSSTLGRGGGGPSVPPVLPVPGVQSYTLDRRYLKDRKGGGRAMSVLNGGAGGADDRRVPGVRSRPPSLPDNFNSSVPRKRGTRDVTPSALRRQVSPSEQDLAYRRGGLAAAYKNRQSRASSLNRSMERGYYGSDVSLSQGQKYPPRALRALSSSTSLHQMHENEPVVMYIPAVSHHNKKADDDDRLSSSVQRSQSILSRKADKKKSGSSGGAKETPPAPGNQLAAVHFAHQESLEDLKKSKELKRSQSVPSDGKFPWLARFRMTKRPVKAREP